MTILTQALKAYLEPLLKKHNAGKLVTHEDLLSSWEAADAVLNDGASDDEVKQVSELHQSQLRAYRNEAKRALHEWATNWTLPDIAEGETEGNYITKCIQQARNQRPTWKVTETVNDMEVANVVKARAVLAYEAEHVEDEEEEGEEEEEQEEEGEEGEEEEEGDAEDDAADDDAAAAASNHEEKTVETPKKKKKKGLLAKKRAAASKAAGKQPVQKKGTQGKVTTAANNKNVRRKGIAGRGRRGGRGGGGNAK